MPEQTVVSAQLIGQVLLDRGLLSEEQLQQVLVAQRKPQERFGEAALRLGLVAEAEMAQFLAEFFQLPYVALSEDEELDFSAVELVPEAMARRYGLIVIKKEGDLLTVAMADPLDVRAVDAVRVETGCRVAKMVASREAVFKAIDRSYHASARLAKSIDKLLAGEATQDGMNLPTASREPAEEEQLKHEASDAPVVQFVNLLLMRAIQERASDIHVEAEEQGMTIRYRVDGLLREVSAPPKSMLQPITTRIKLLGNLDIAERRLPQDGRFKFKVFDKTIDVRLSCLPTVFGEKLVLRILDRGALILDMTSLGFEPAMLETFRETLKLPYGLIILTGPTGSGKTTTLYAALNTIRTPTKNIVTIEDPVEYQLPKINQVHTKADIGLTFAAGLRSILRQDPDIIMVGEMRDRETADICIRSALTGHLVLSTLHTNDSVSAVSRLTDMGIEPYLLSATLSVVMAQRLVRRTCPDCAEPWQPPVDLLKRLQKLAGSESSSWNFQRGSGCRRCEQTGYFGRIAVYEQFVVTDPIKSLIAEGARLHELLQAAKREGLQTLLQSSLNKVREGVTTLDEALSVCATHADH
ncbi:MAG: hypothetical protein A3G88_06000 [Omnitrophica WOR_2 bacterium RIFCSPLOWO2_12_FULL_63_16]|nr:MAG: hypothetical protein A3G88_06000 [Omnitrophica WOR_2 bacterium RIFCSPLOWO2_12_FULL_63_16]